MAFPAAPVANVLPINPTAPVQPQGILRVVTPDERTAMDAAAVPPKDPDIVLDNLGAHISKRFEMMNRHRGSASGWNERLLSAQRVFNGQYDADQLREIRKFGGSDVFARVISVKCRGASSLLREVYLGAEKAWGLDPTPDPVLPDDVAGSVAALVTVETQNAAMFGGQQLDLGQIRDRTNNLMEAAKSAAKKKARKEALKSEHKLDDILIEGNFYKALAEFIVDLPLFPFACIKGPVVRIVPTLKWTNGKMVSEQKARMFWNRVSPFDVWFSPGVADIEDAEVIERTRLTRADLNDLLGLDGYNQEKLRLVLQDYPAGIHDVQESTDTERAVNESRENPWMNDSGLYDCLEYHGNVQGKMLIDWGFSTDEVTDEDRDYFIQAWKIGRYVIKAQLSPNPRKRHPYYITSFEKVPGTPVGNALPDILNDIQNVCNAALRSLVNNLSIASGPQVVVDDSMLAAGENGDELYAWKRWHITRDPMAPQMNGSQKPIDFFQPNSHAQENLAVYEKFTQIADELSAIPRYITGSDRMGGAGRTASGLAMLMGNASKILQTVAANIDRDVMEPLLQGLYDMVMMTDTSGIFRGDEIVRVRGVDVAVQRETNRQRQIEFLTATANPIDTQIMGPKGRASVLRSVAATIGLEGQDIVPSEEDLDAIIKGQGQMPGPEAGLTPDGKPPEGDPSQQPQPGPGDQAEQMGVPEAAPQRNVTMAPSSKQPNMEDGGLVPKRFITRIIHDTETGRAIGFEDIAEN